MNGLPCSRCAGSRYSPSQYSSALVQARSRLECVTPQLRMRSERFSQRRAETSFRMTSATTSTAIARRWWHGRESFESVRWLDQEQPTAEFLIEHHTSDLKVLCVPF